MAVPRSSKWFDGTLFGYQFRLKRGEEPGYVKQVVRSNLPFNQSEEHDGKFNTRQDVRTLWQTSWSDGALWNKPVLSASSISSYNTAEGVDVTTSPGDLIPLPTVTTSTAEAAALYRPSASVLVDGVIYAVRDTGSFTGIRQWTGSAWANFSTAFNGADTNEPVSLFHAAATNNLVMLAADGNVYEMSRGDSSDSTIADVGTIYEGANGFMHFGRMFIYNGDVLYEITDPFTSPAVSSPPIYDDGMGPDYINEVSTSAASNDRLVEKNRLAIATSEGIYIVKNVEQEGLPTAFITRVDRANDGTNIGVPVATLPPGMVALDVSYHLGSLLISATSDVDLVMRNDLTNSKYPRIDMYVYTPRNGLGSIGSPLGGETPDEAPYKFAGTFGANVYIGGQKRVWVYDAIRGGLHPLFTHFQSGQFGACVGRAYQTTDASGNRVVRFFDSQMNYFDMEIDTGTDNDSQTRQLESNYFDFNIPAEKKTLSHITLMTDGVQSGETWTVTISVDDAAFATGTSVTSADANTVKKRITSPLTGFRFRYKVAYATTGAVASPSRLKGIVFHAIEGEMVTRWRLDIDGREFRNVENQVVAPEDVLADFETVAGTATIGTFVDEFRKTSSTHNVKVDSVSIARSSLQELDSIQVVVTEDV